MSRGFVPILEPLCHTLGPYHTFGSVRAALCFEHVTMGECKQGMIAINVCRTGKDYLNVLNVNVVGPFLVTKHFLPSLKKKQTRVVVQTSSICGSISAARAGAFGGFLIAYNASKVCLCHVFPGNAL